MHWSRLRVLSASLVALPLLSACLEVEPVQPSSRLQRITDGTADDEDAAVIALVKDGTIYCTGTAISPTVVLTAAHCVHGLAPDMISVYEGSSLAASGTTITVAGLLAHPRYEPRRRDNDIALLQLREKIATNPRALLSRPFDSSFLGRDLRLVGFGKISATDSSALRRRQGQSRIAAYTPTDFSYSPTPSMTCAGDSGGPAFLTVAGVELLAGVTSEGDIDCVESARSTRVDLHLEEFIEPFMAQAEDGSTPVGTRCFTNGQCRSGSCLPAADLPAISFCSTSCDSDDDCPEPTRCEQSSCRQPAPSPGTLGARCATSDDCLSGICARRDEAELPICSVRCFVENESPCSDDLVCLPNIDAPRRFACFSPDDSAGCSTNGRFRGRIDVLIGLALLCVASIRARRRR